MNQSKSALITLISVFFFWGFVAASNDILIPVFKESLNLEQWQSQMISLAFYIAYTVGSILYMLFNRITNSDLIFKTGYKNALIYGLLISASGTLLFIPAARLNSFNLMITGLFLVGLGFSLQQIVANPLTIAMGSEQTGAQRLSLAGGINNIGTTIGPVVISYALFGGMANYTSIGLNEVKTPYILLGFAFALFAFIIKLSKIPDNVLNKENNLTQISDKINALKFPQLILGMVAIFVYVGVEVSSASNLPELIKHELNIPTSAVAPYVSLFWASLMIGRWTSAADTLTKNNLYRKILRFIMPYMAFALFILVNVIANNNTNIFYVYVIPIFILIIADLICMGNAVKQLMLFSALGIVSIIVSMLSGGIVSIYAIICVGLFCSTLWPCIFNLAIKGLGKNTNQGAGYLIMMIMGGGIISMIQGKLADQNLLGIKNSYIVGIACFAYLAYYAVKAKNILANQGIKV